MGHCCIEWWKSTTWPWPQTTVYLFHPRHATHQILAAPFTNGSNFRITTGIYSIGRCYWPKGNCPMMFVRLLCTQHSLVPPRNSSDPSLSYIHVCVSYFLQPRDVISSFQIHLDVKRASFFRPSHNIQIPSPFHLRHTAF